MAKVSAKGSKNSIENRGKKLSYFYNDIEVSPVKYYGFFVGSGTFIAMENLKTGNVILDSKGNVMPWSGNAKKKI